MKRVNPDSTVQPICMGGHCDSSGQSDLSNAGYRGLPIIAYRRANEDGTFDSLCLRCFWTAAIGLSEAGLAEAESKHVCGTVPALVRHHRSVPVVH
jgi:hypothetical protein